MPPQERDPLARTDRLLIDGNNVLHQLDRSPAVAGQRAGLVGRIRAVIPADVGIELVFDGPAERGMRGERIAAGTTVRFAGPRSADAVIVGLVEEALRAAGPVATAGLLVVTNDGDLRRQAYRLGARTVRVPWLLGRLDGPGRRGGRPAPVSVGQPRAPRPPQTPDDGDTERAGWRTGRGATKKRGNPRRSPRTGRTGRIPG